MDAKLQKFSIAVCGILIIILLGYNLTVLANISTGIENRMELFSGKLSANNANSGQTAAPEPPKPLPKISFVKIVDSDYNNFVDLSGLETELSQIADIVSSRTLELGSEDAILLVKKYKIEKIPAVLISGETEKSDVLMNAWLQLGTIESDGILVLRNVPPIYLDLSSGKIRGETSIVYLDDPVHVGVYDVKLQKSIIGRFGVIPLNETTVDFNSINGQKILSDYNITEVPTIILSGDLNVYTALNQIWKQVGSIERDGNYIFRNISALGDANFFDIQLNKIVNGKDSNSGSGSNA